MNTFYVYEHVCPLDKKIFYIGMGQKDRAWTITSKARSQEHREFMLWLIELGFVASDWTKIVHRQLAKQEAYYKERQLIYEIKPKFNKDIDQRCMSMIDVEVAKDLRSDGMTWEEIGQHLEFAAPTVAYHVKKNSMAP